MGRRGSNQPPSHTALKSKIADLRAALAQAQTSKEPSEEEKAEIDANFKRALRRHIRQLRANDKERKRQALLKMTDFAP